MQLVILGILKLRQVSMGFGFGLVSKCFSGTQLVSQVHELQLSVQLQLRCSIHIRLMAQSTMMARMKSQNSTCCSPNCSLNMPEMVRGKKAECVHSMEALWQRLCVCVWGGKREIQRWVNRGRKIGDRVYCQWVRLPPPVAERFAADFSQQPTAFSQQLPTLQLLQNRP